MNLRPIELRLERLIIHSRWLMAPFYLGLVVALALLLIKFLQVLVETIPDTFSQTDTEMIMLVLSLIDLTLVGNLLLMVMFSGYETFVEKIVHAGEAERPDWMGKVDFSGLKIKLIGSIVAISGIYLLRVFANIKHYEESEVVLMIAIHLAFVTSGVLLAVMDKLSAAGGEHKDVEP